MSREKSRAERANNLLRQRVRCSTEMISGLDKKIADSECKSSTLEQSISKLDSLNRKLTLRNTNLNQRISELEFSLESSIPNDDHQKMVNDLESLLSEKEIIITNLKKRLTSAEEASHAHNTQVVVALKQNQDLVRSIANKDEELYQMRSENENLLLRMSLVQGEAEKQSHIHDQQVQSIEKHHSLAIHMLDKSQTAQARKLQSELELTAKLARIKDLQLDQLQARLMDYEIQLTQQKTRDICIDIGVQRDTDVVIASSQTEDRTRRTVATEHDETIAKEFCSLSREEVGNIRKHLCCSSCVSSDARPVSTLFPCGHGLCSDCVAVAMQSDMNRSGIACKQCGNNLPVTRVSLNYPMIAIAYYLESILPPRDC